VADYFKSTCLNRNLKVLLAIKMGEPSPLERKHESGVKILLRMCAPICAPSAHMMGTRKMITYA